MRYHLCFTQFTSNLHYSEIHICITKKSLCHSEIHICLTQIFYCVSLRNPICTYIKPPCFTQKALVRFKHLHFISLNIPLYLNQISSLFHPEIPFSITKTTLYSVHNISLFEHGSEILFFHSDIPVFTQKSPFSLRDPLFLT